jgi:hypothetical protein
MSSDPSERVVWAGGARFDAGFNFRAGGPAFELPGGRSFTVFEGAVGLTFF